MPQGLLARFLIFKILYLPLIALINPFRTPLRELAFQIVLPVLRVIIHRRLRSQVGVVGSLDRRLKQDLLLRDYVIQAELNDRFRSRLLFRARPTIALPKNSDEGNLSPIKDFYLNIVRPYIFTNPLRIFLKILSFFPLIYTVL